MSAETLLDSWDKPVTTSADRAGYSFALVGFLGNNPQARATVGYGWPRAGRRITEGELVTVAVFAAPEHGDGQLLEASYLDFVDEDLEMAAWNRAAGLRGIKRAEQE